MSSRLALFRSGPWMDALRLGFITFVFHEVVWLALNFPFLYIEKHQLFPQYKIQKTKRVPYQEIEAMFWQMLKEHVLSILPVSVISSLFLYDIITLELIPIHSLALQVGANLLLYDVQFYIIHRFLHTKWGYEHIHKVHHEYKAPFALSSEHAHPLESVFCFTVPLVVSMVVVVWWVGSLSLWQIWTTIAIQEFRSVEGHSGYSFPFFLEHWPILSIVEGGATHHDLHHSLFKYNYGPKWLDILCGTHINFNEKPAADQSQ